MYEDLQFRTTDLTKWGAGKGTKLTALEVDTNFWVLIQRILSLETNPPEVNQIDHFTTVGTEFVVHMQNGDTFGPFTLPVAAFTWRGEWTAGVSYAELDFVSVEDDGIYLVLHPHDSATEFDPAEETTEGPLYHKIFGVPHVYDLGVFISGVPGIYENPGEPIFQWVALRPFFIEEGAPNSRAFLKTPPTETLIFEIFKNGVLSIGFIIFQGAPSEEETTDEMLDRRYGAFSFPDSESFDVDDVLSVNRPDDLDLTAANLSIGFAATRGELP